MVPVIPAGAVAFSNTPSTHLRRMVAPFGMCRMASEQIDPRPAHGRGLIAPLIEKPFGLSDKTCPSPWRHACWAINGDEPRHPFRPRMGKNRTSGAAGSRVPDGCDSAARISVLCVADRRTTAVALCGLAKARRDTSRTDHLARGVNDALTISA
jgi:hypothetical protein